MSVRPGINAAYWLFSCIALVICALDLLFYILPLDGSDLQGIAMIVGIPILLASIPISLIAIVLSVINRSEWPLLVMSASVVVVFVVLLASDEWGLVSDQVAIALYNAAAVPMVILCVRWFTHARKRAARHTEVQKSEP